MASSRFLRQPLNTYRPYAADAATSANSGATAQTAPNADSEAARHEQPPRFVAISPTVVEGRCGNRPHPAFRFRRCRESYPLGAAPPLQELLPAGGAASRVKPAIDTVGVSVRSASVMRRNPTGRSLRDRRTSTSDA